MSRRSANSMPRTCTIRRAPLEPAPRPNWLIKSNERGPRLVEQATFSELQLLRCLPTRREDLSSGRRLRYQAPRWRNSALIPLALCAIRATPKVPPSLVSRGNGYKTRAAFYSRFGLGSGCFLNVFFRSRPLQVARYAAALKRARCERFSRYLLWKLA